MSRDVTDAALIPIDLPDLSAESGLILRVSGPDRLIFARGDCVEVHPTFVQGADPYSKPSLVLKLPGKVTALAADGADIWVACDGAVFRAEGEAFLKVTHTHCRIKALTPLTRYLVVMTADHLVVLDRVRGHVLAKLDRPRGAARMKPDRGGDAVLVSVPARREVHRIDVDRHCRGKGRGDTPPRRPPPERPESEDKCCPPPKSCCCPPNREPERPGSSTPNPQRPDPIPPGDNCRPGDDGDGDGCIITYAIGAKLVRINICRPGEAPCIVTLRWPIGELRRAGSRLIALSQDRRRVAVVDFETLDLINERVVGVPAPVMLTLADSSDVLLASNTGGAPTLIQAAPATAQAGLADLEIAAPTTVAFSDPYPLNDWSIDGHQTGSRNVLVIPLLAPGQGFSGDIADYKDWAFSSGLLEKVQAYFDECSYGRFDVNFQIFGIDTDDLYIGNPISTLVDFEQFYNDPWAPARLEATVAFGGGDIITFSGDETMELRARPAIRSAETFDIRFAAASARWRLPDSSVTLSFDPGAVPPRAFNIEGRDRNGATFGITASYNDPALPQVDVVVSRARLETGDAQSELETVLNDMIATATPPGDDPIMLAEVIWHNDTNSDNGMLHVRFRFVSGGGGDAPFVDDFDVTTSFMLFPELAMPDASSGEPIEIMGRFDTAGAGFQMNMTWLLRRALADGIMAHPDFDNLREPYFRIVADNMPSGFVVDGSLLTCRISLNIDDGHARDDADDPTAVTLEAQSGLAKIGMDAPVSEDGPDFVWDKRNALAKSGDLLDAAWTAVISRVVEFHGDQTTAVTRINRNIFGVGLDPAEQAAADVPHSFIFAYVDAAPSEVPGDPAWLSFPPDWVGRIRGAARWTTATDTLGRAPDLINTRQKVIMPFFTNTAADGGRTEDSADTVAHELGHSLLGLADQYSGAAYRGDVQYIGQRDLMGDATTWPHLCLYHKVIKGWLDDDGNDVALLVRPNEGETLTRELIVVELERWDPGWDSAALNTIRAAVPGSGGNPLPVVAGAVMRLGGDGRLFNTLELRRSTPQFSQAMAPSRLVVANAYGYEDDTRYQDPDVDLSDAEVQRTLSVIKQFRRKIHLLGDIFANDTFNLVDAPEFPEPGLDITFEDSGVATVNGRQILAARVTINWTPRGNIDLGFVDATPNWQSPDIGVEAPEFTLNADTGYPEGEPVDQGDVVVKPSGEDEVLPHRVFVRVHNFGNVEARNVQVQLLRFEPGGAGDHPDDAAETLEDEISAIAGGSFETIAFPWDVTRDTDEHSCLRAQIGDRDVAPLPGTNEPAGSDDTNWVNDHAQQNVFEYTSEQVNPVDPISLRYAVHNEGPLPEDVALYPVGLPTGVTVTIVPQTFRLGPGKSLTARVRIDQDSERGRLECGKDFTFRVEAWRVESEAEERWGACEYKIKLRTKTAIDIGGSWFANNFDLYGQIDPDVGLGQVRLHITGTTGIDVWRTVKLGPGATFELEDVIAGGSGDRLFVTAYYDGSSEFAASQSDVLEMPFSNVG